VENFQFQNCTRIVFGRNEHTAVGRELKKVGTKILLNYGGGSIKSSGLYDSVRDSLRAQGLPFVELGGVKPNPRLSLVREGIELCRSNAVDCVLAVGGGSVIDSAKAIALGVPYAGDVWDFFEGKAEARTALPVGVVLTIAAAGSESSTGTVVTRDEDSNKRPYDNPVLIPRFAILNPELTYTLSAYQTACGAADIMAHVMERYFTHTTGTDFIDRLSEATLRTVINNTRAVLRDPKNYAARSELMWAGTIAHNSLLGTGREEDWGSHMIEHELSGFYDVAHGAGLAVIFPAWMRYVHELNVNRFLQFAVRVWDVDLPYESPEAIATEGIRKLESFFLEIGLPVSLSGLNIPLDTLEEIAARATKNGPVGRFKKLYEDDVYRILKSAE
jgi:alcohol dehydrogenase